MLTPDEQNELQRAVQLIAGVVVAKGDQADSMADTELAALLLDGRWSTVEVHEAARRLAEIDTLRAEIERLSEVDRLLALALAKHDERVAEIERLRCDLAAAKARVNTDPIPPEDLQRASEFVRDQGWLSDSGASTGHSRSASPPDSSALNEKEPHADA